MPNWPSLLPSLASLSLLCSVLGPNRSFTVTLFSAHILFSWAVGGLVMDWWWVCQSFLSAGCKKKHTEESRLMGGTAFGLAPMFCLPVKCIGLSHTFLWSAVSVSMGQYSGQPTCFWKRHLKSGRDPFNGSTAWGAHCG